MNPCPEQKSDGDAITMHYPWIPHWSLTYVEPLMVLLAKRGLLRSSYEDSTVGDLCCGEGITGRVFLNKAIGTWSLIGVDQNLRMIEIARQQNVFRSTYLVGDAHKLPLRNNTLNLVLLTQALHRVRNAVACLHECRRVLRSGGTVVVANLYGDGKQGSLKEFFNIVTGLMKQNRIEGRIRRPSVLEYGKLESYALAAEMKHFELISDSKQMVVRSEEEALYCYPFAWYLWDIPEQTMRDDMWQKIVTRLVGESITLEMGFLLGSW